MGAVRSTLAIVHRLARFVRYTVRMTRILRTFVAILALLGLQGPLQADPNDAHHKATQGATEATQGVSSAPVRPALWKLSDADTTIWLFGTVHALPANVGWYRGEVAIAFEGAKELVTEIPETSPQDMSSVVLTKALLPKGQTLRGLLDADQRGRFEKALASLGLPASALDPYEPWYAAITLASLPIVRSGFVPENGVESLLSTRASTLGHPREGLETAEYQLGLFDSLPMDVQKRYVLEVADNLPTISDDLGRIIEAWKTGDAENLARLMNEQEDDPAIMEALMFRRNRAWADWIKSRLDRPGSVFIAVGAGHLAGPGSVQDELKARGLTVQRVQ